MGKIRYLGERDASWRLSQMRERRVKGWWLLETYECPHCDGLHIGHRPEPLTPEKAVTLVKDFERLQTEWLAGLTNEERGELQAELNFLLSNPERFGKIRPDLPPEFFKIAAESMFRVGFSN